MAHRVAIVGGGFGGLYAAQALKRAPVDVTLIDRRNFHLFQPLLYQVATGVLSPANIAAPLRSVLRRQKNARVLLAEVRDFDVERRQVLLADGAESYDTLIVAAGSTFNYFGHDAWRKAAPGLKTLEDATDIRRRMLTAFEDAERMDDPARIAQRLTFVIVGGGPTGVELAGALAEVARYTLKRDFRRINPADARIILVEGRDRVLPPYPPKLSADAARSLARLGVEIRTHGQVIGIEPHAVTLATGDEVETIPAGVVLWTAGVQPSPLARKLADAAGAPTDRLGRLIVEPDLSLPDHPEILVLGDMALCRDEQGNPLPAVAPVAMQQGRYAARWIQDRLAGQVALPFRYRNRGDMAVIGRGAAVANIAGFMISGTPAWLAWLFVHLMYLVQFQNRILVLIQWGWNYLTMNRAARLITEEDRNAEDRCSSEDDRPRANEEPAVRAQS